MFVELLSSICIIFYNIARSLARETPRIELISADEDTLI
jgi:hypothetical protein